MASRELRATAVAIVVGALVAAALVGAGTTIPAGRSCPSVPSVKTPFGPGLAFSVITESSVGPTHWYNTSVQDANALRLDNLVFAAFHPNETLVHPGLAWNFSLWNASARLVAAYSVATGATNGWATNSSLPLESGEMYSLRSPSENLSGDPWVTVESGVNAEGCPAGGQTIQPIP